MLEEGIVEAITEGDYSDDALRGDDTEVEAGASESVKSEAVEQTSEPQTSEPQTSEPQTEEKGIPPGVLAELRRSHNELKRQNEQLRNDYLQQVQEMRQAQQAPPKVQEPNWDEDPIGYMRHQNEQLQSQIQQMQQAQQQVQHQTQQQQQTQQLVNTIKSYENAYKAQHNDYDNALQHFRNANVMRHQSFGMSEEASQQKALEQEIQDMAYAMQQGINPAEYVYNMARSYGYAPSAQQRPAAEQQLDSMQQGQKAQSLGGSGLPSPSEIADMDDNEFHELIAAQKELGYR